MTIVSVDTDYDALTVTLIAEFDSPIDRVWRLWADPREVERWWGPPDYPTTVETHALIAGGEVLYSMVGPEGDEHWGVWLIRSTDPPTSLEFTDAFADSDGTPLEDEPATDISVRLREHEAGTRMEMRLRFATREAMERIVETGTIEALKHGVGQMAAVLAS